MQLRQTLSRVMKKSTILRTHSDEVTMTENRRQKTIYIFLLIACAALAALCRRSYANQAQSTERLYARKQTWQQTMLAWRKKIGNRLIEPGIQKHLSRQIEKDFPIESDWIDQDCRADVYKWLAGQADAGIEKKMIRAVLDELGSAGSKPARDFERLCKSKAGPDDPRWLDLYVKACQQRRGIRLKPLMEKCRKIVFTKHFNMGGKALQHGRFALRLHRSPV